VITAWKWLASGIRVRTDNIGRGSKKKTRITDKSLDWTVVNKTPHKDWETYDGRKEMGKGLAKLVREASKM